MIQATLQNKKKKIRIGDYQGDGTTVKRQPRKTGKESTTPHNATRFAPVHTGSSAGRGSHTGATNMNLHLTALAPGDPDLSETDVKPDKQQQLGDPGMRSPTTITPRSITYTLRRGYDHSPFVCFLALSYNHSHSHLKLRSLTGFSFAGHSVKQRRIDIRLLTRWMVVG